MKIVLCFVTFVTIANSSPDRRWLVDNPCPYHCSSSGLAQPVCGSDWKTYGSMCELEVVNCQRKLCNSPPITVQHSGGCYSGRRSLRDKIARQLEPCPDRCSSSGLAIPVCGSDGKSYGSSCEFEVAKCLHSCGGHKLTAHQCPNWG